MSKNCAIIGMWTFHRSISDTLLNTDYSAQGQLTVTPSHWIETGAMNDMPFHHHYCIRIDSSLTIMFADGSIFYNLKDIHKSECIQHICKNDIYRGMWFLREKTLTLQWDVSGPRKNYTMITTYCKVPAKSMRISR